MLLAGWSNGDFNVLAQSGKKFHQASNGKITRTVSHQQRNLRLLHTENLGDLYLRHAAVFKDPVDLQRQPRLQQILFGIGQTQVGEDVSASFGYASAAAVLLSWLGSHI